MRRLLMLCAFVFALTLVTAGAAGAQSAPGYGGTPPTDVEGDAVGNDGGTPPTEEAVLGDVTTRAPSVSAGVGGLPVTGGDLVGLTVLGLGAIGVGAAMTIRRRTAA